ncbi:MAG: hypothetical protein IPH69_05370 [Bacteroidales bacterium]|nr:hypothetical protein [Bacteroidales bacterium]
MARHLTIIALTFLLTISAIGQTSYLDMQQQVLKKNIVDSLFVFGKWTEEGPGETHLKYLGRVVANDGKVLKIMNSCWFWGLSHRATCTILIFNENNQPLGNYSGLMIYELPDKFVNGKLIFLNTDKECLSITTTIDFGNGIPEHIFIKCKEDYGNKYTFSRD